jgi:hypothetical protein
MFSGTSLIRDFKSCSSKLSGFVIQLYQQLFKEEIQVKEFSSNRKCDQNVIVRSLTSG